MKLFLDSSVLLAASGSAKGASRMLITNQEQHQQELVSSLYCLEETQYNLPKLGKTAASVFKQVVFPEVTFEDTTYVTEQPLVYPVTKDRPVVTSALQLECDALLTLDRADFQKLLGNQVYNMWIMTPGDWLRRLREACE